MQLETDIACLEDGSESDGIAGQDGIASQDRFGDLIISKNKRRNVRANLEWKLKYTFLFF